MRVASWRAFWQQNLWKMRPKTFQKTSAVLILKTMEINASLARKGCQNRRKLAAVTSNFSEHAIILLLQRI